jgi:hypothetical protein
MYEVPELTYWHTTGVGADVASFILTGVVFIRGSKKLIKQQNIPRKQVGSGGNFRKWIRQNDTDPNRSGSVTLLVIYQNGIQWRLKEKS